MKERINVTIEYDLIWQLKNETKHIKNLSAFFEKCLENSIKNYKEKNGMITDDKGNENFKRKYGYDINEAIKIVKGDWEDDYLEEILQKKKN